MFKTTRALVLREVKYKDADKLLTVLTEDEGKLTVKARGALRRSCRYAAAAQPLVFSEMTLFGNRGKWSINEAQTIECFLALRDELSSMALASFFAEALESVSDEDSPNAAVLQLGLNSLFALSRGLYSQEHIKAAFELRLMCLSGFEPELYGCPVCGRADIPEALFSINGGAIRCRGCNTGEGGVSLPVGPAMLEAMRYICSAPARRVFSFELGGADTARLSDLTEAYVAAQLERSFSSLGYWKSVRRSERADGVVT